MTYLTNTFRLIKLLRSQPGLTQAQIVERTGVNQRDVSRLLRQLEVVASGRKWPRRYSIKLPAAKRKALERKAVA